MNFQELLKIAEAMLNCPICGSAFGSDHLRVRGVIDNRLIIESSCDYGHKPASVIFVTSFSNNPYSIGNVQMLQPVTKEYVSELSTFLQSFDGDFRKHF